MRLLMSRVTGNHFMLGIFKRNKGAHHPEDASANPSEEPEDNPQLPEKKGFFKKLTRGLKRTKSHFSEGIANLFLGRKIIDQSLFDDIETQLLSADVGVEVTNEIMSQLTEQLQRKQLKDPEVFFAELRQQLLRILQCCEVPLKVETQKKPFVVLMVGVNGSGKTTTIGKLAKRFQDQGLSVMLAAGDTFRAAAIEQVQVWGERNNVPVIAQQAGSDSASVIYDAFSAAKARNVDVLLADTAGRLHTQDNLMAELEKIKRVLGKLDPDAPHEVLLVLDAGIGQNTLVQAEHFQKAVDVSGLVLSKMDGTAKGGVIFAVAKRFSIPIRFVGVGEGIDDLQPFSADAFIDALFNKDDSVD